MLWQLLFINGARQGVDDRVEFGEEDLVACSRSEAVRIVWASAQ